MVPLIVAGLLVGSGCTSQSEPAAPTHPSAELISDYEVGPLGDRADDIAKQLQPVAQCPDLVGPQDLLQHPARVGFVYCPRADGDIGILAYDDPAAVYYFVESTPTGTGEGRQFLIGSDWAVYGPPNVLPQAKSLLGGELYADPSAALIEHPGYSEDGPFMHCYTFLTSIVIEFVKTGDNHLPELDQTIPGIAEGYDAAMSGVVPRLASYRSGDDEAARSDLLPYADRMRGVCHKLNPGPPS